MTETDFTQKKCKDTLGNEFTERNCIKNTQKTMQNHRKTIKNYEKKQRH
jgi:hypothetical protein